MGITVKEALKIKGLDQAKLICGENGLYREIKRVSVIECPESPEMFIEGDFFITAFYALKDDSDAQLEMVKALVEKKSSGLCVINLYLDDLSDDIKQYANETNFPIMFLHHTVPYAEIITNIMYSIIQKKDEDLIEMLIDSLLQSEKDKSEILELAKKINPYFQEKILIIYLNDFLKDIDENYRGFKEKMQLPPYWSLVKYKEGILLISSFPNQKKFNARFIENFATDVINKIKSVAKSKNIKLKSGFSNIHNLEDLPKGLNEALIAGRIANQMNYKSTVFYKDIGVYKLLLDLNAIAEDKLKKFSNEIINPIKEYDQEHNAKLLQTILCFVENDGDLNKTAKDLYTHVNTVRYRINKVKEILNMEHLNLEFFYQIIIALKIHSLH